MNAQEILLALLMLAPVASASPEQFVQWEGNGHYYKAVASKKNIHWERAKTKAEQAGGYLATITSAAENKFVFSLIDDEKYWRPYAAGSRNLVGPWIGGYQEDDAPEPDGGWRWVTGEEFHYTSWGPGQPNNRFYGKNENRMKYFSENSSKRKPTWNDCPNYMAGHPVHAYVIEMDQPPTNKE